MSYTAQPQPCIINKKIRVIRVIGGQPKNRANPHSLRQAQGAGAERKQFLQYCTFSIVTSSIKKIRVIGVIGGQPKNRANPRSLRHGRVQSASNR